MANSRLLIIFALMKKYIVMIGICLVLLACHGNKSDEEKAVPLLSKIESLYREGHYQAALDSIVQLREKYPTAINARKKALVIWQDASLKKAQDDIAKTDSALQATTSQYNEAKTFHDKNLLRVKRDSLQTRYDALCGTVRIIHKRQQERSR